MGLKLRNGGGGSSGGGGGTIDATARAQIANLVPKTDVANQAAIDAGTAGKVVDAALLKANLANLKANAEIFTNTATKATYEATLAVADAGKLIFQDDTDTLYIWTGTASTAIGGAGATPELPVKQKATTSSPEVGFNNIYPNGATVGTAPAFVANQNYATSIIDAGGTTVSTQVYVAGASAWLEITEPANASAVSVKVKATGEAPEVGFNNIYPDGATIGTAPTVVTGEQYGTGFQNAGGTQVVNQKVYNAVGTAWLEITEDDGTDFKGEVAALPAIAGYTQGNRVYVNVDTTDPIGFYTLVGTTWVTEK